MIYLYNVKWCLLCTYYSLYNTTMQSHQHDNFKKWQEKETRWANKSWQSRRRVWAGGVLESNSKIGCQPQVYVQEYYRRSWRCHLHVWASRVVRKVRIVLFKIQELLCEGLQRWGIPLHSNASRLYFKQQYACSADKVEGQKRDQHGSIRHRSIYVKIKIQGIGLEGQEYWRIQQEFILPVWR